MKMRLPILRGFTRLLTLMASSLLVFTASAQFLYLDFDGVRGDSTRKGFEGQIEVENFSFGMLTRGEFTFQANKNLDSSSVPLQLLCASGKSAKKAVLTFSKVVGANAALLPVYSITLTEVAVVSAGMSGDVSRGVSDSYTLKFNQVRWQFNTIGLDGKISGTNSAGWDIVANKVL